MHTCAHTPQLLSQDTRTSLVYLETRRGGGEAVERKREGRLGRGKTENWSGEDGNRISK